MENPILYPIRKFGIAGAILLISAMIVYWELAVGVLTVQGFIWDASIMLALHSFSQPWLDGLFYMITRTGDLLVVIPLLIMFIYLWRRSEKITAGLLILSAVLAPFFSWFLKEQFARPRPNVFTPLVVEQSASFPSGHTLTAVAVYGLISILLWQRGKRILSVISGIWVFLIALSRIYLGVHYPSDVLASLALGTIWIIIILFLERVLKARAAAKS